MKACDNSLPDSGAALTPLIARVVELGRGPPALVRWVSARAARGESPRELAAQLSRELVRAMIEPPAPPDLLTDTALSPGSWRETLR